MVVSVARRAAAFGVAVALSGCVAAVTPERSPSPRPISEAEVLPVPPAAGARAATNETNETGEKPVAMDASVSRAAPPGVPDSRPVALPGPASSTPEPYPPGYSPSSGRGPAAAVPPPVTVEATPVAEPAPGPSLAREPAAVEQAPEPPFSVPDRAEIRDVLAEFVGPRRRSLEEALRRARRYLPSIREALAAEGLPPELAYLPLVESNFEPAACSSAGALGLWQFIESTARASGLRVDWWVDERLDPEAASLAAVRHLRELYDQFGDWELVLAAYNAGSGGVGRALSSAGTDSFWELCEARRLRQETRRYVPKFYAVLTIARDPERYGLADEGTPAAPGWDTVRVDSPVDLFTVSRLTGFPVYRLRGLNPALLRAVTPPGEERYPLRVPEGWGERVARALEALPVASRTSFVRHTVRPGDTLWGIARRYGTETAPIAELNGIDDARALRPGRELAVPVRAGVRRLGVAPAEEKDGSGRGAGVYVVATGDTAWGIARRYGCSADVLLSRNGLSKAATLRPGDRLSVDSCEAPASSPGRGRDDHERVHVVRAGETLWTISRRYGVSLAELRRQNRLDEDGVIRPGDRLVVRGGSGGAS